MINFCEECGNIMKMINLDGFLKFKCKCGIVKNPNNSDFEPYMKKYPKNSRVKIINKDFKEKLQKFGIKHLYHLTPILNIPSILQNGLLSWNLLSEKGIKPFNYASEGLLKESKNNFSSNCFGEDIYDYIRLTRNLRQFQRISLGSLAIVL
ncbi:MAG: DarT ssDNA thymidine ADP-ribosyltransferase family protein [Candidatus Helarchaeota archaeon]